MRTDYGEIAAIFAKCKADHQSAEWRLGYTATLVALGLPKGSTVLDFGCGAGTFSTVLSQSGLTVTGVDTSQEMIEEARKRDPEGEYKHYRGLLGELLKGRRFDAICATFSFCTIPDTELRYILKDIRSLLKKGGELIVLDPNHEQAHGVKYATLEYHPKEGVKSGDLVSVTLKRNGDEVRLDGDIYRTHTDYRWLLESTGFIVQRMDEPIPDPSWGSEWEIERQHPPFLLIIAS